MGCQLLLDQIRVRSSPCFLDPRPLNDYLQQVAAGLRAIAVRLLDQVTQQQAQQSQIDMYQGLCGQAARVSFAALSSQFIKP